MFPKQAFVFLTIAPVLFVACYESTKIMSVEQKAFDRFCLVAPTVWNLPVEYESKRSWFVGKRGNKKGLSGACVSRPYWAITDTVANFSSSHPPQKLVSRRKKLVLLDRQRLFSTDDRRSAGTNWLKFAQFKIFVAFPMNSLPFLEKYRKQLFPAVRWSARLIWNPVELL